MKALISLAFVSVPPLFYLARTYLLDETTISVPFSEQGRCNSYDKNWFQVQRGWFYDEVVEMEEGPGMREYRVMGHGSSVRPVKMILLKE